MLCAATALLALSPPRSRNPQGHLKRALTLGIILLLRCVHRPLPPLCSLCRWLCGYLPGGTLLTGTSMPCMFNDESKHNIVIVVVLVILYYSTDIVLGYI